MIELFQMIVPVLEVMFIAVMIYFFLTFFWNTRAMDLIFGILAFFFIYGLATWFHLPVLQKLMLSFVNVAVLGMVIIFQPEIRLALGKLTFKGKKFREMSEFDKFVENLAHSVYRLSERRIGGLIILENQDLLDEYAQKAVMVEAEFSPELMESIFATTTPLHDGAVIIRETKILSAATILPLADDSSQLSRSMGTRHRAGLGISQITDALIIVVSEESGKVSIARDGIMTRGVKVDRFKGIIRSVFTPPKSVHEAPLNIKSWVRQWTD